MGRKETLMKSLDKKYTAKSWAIELASNLRNIRQNDKRMPIRDLAKETGIGCNRLTDIELGRTVMTVSEMLRIVKALDYSIIITKNTKSHD